MPMPYPDQPVEPGREQFAEFEATFYEQLIEGEQRNIQHSLAMLRQKIRLGRPNLDYCHLHTGSMHEAAVRLGGLRTDGYPASQPSHQPH